MWPSTCIDRVECPNFRQAANDRIRRHPNSQRVGTVTQSEQTTHSHTGLPGTKNDSPLSRSTRPTVSVHGTVTPAHAALARHAILAELTLVDLRKKRFGTIGRRKTPQPGTGNKRKECAWLIMAAPGGFPGKQSLVKTVRWRVPELLVWTRNLGNGK